MDEDERRWTAMDEVAERRDARPAWERLMRRYEAHGLVVDDAAAEQLADAALYATDARDALPHRWRCIRGRLGYPCDCEECDVPF